MYCSSLKMEQSYLYIRKLSTWMMKLYRLFSDPQKSPWNREL